MRLVQVALCALLLAGLPAGAQEESRAPWIDPNWTPAPPKEGYSYPDCFCTDSDGVRIELGQLACLRIGSRRVLARCETSLNNTTWRPQAEGCPGV